MNKPGDATVGRPGRRLLIHLGIQVVLILLYFLPGGLIWNRVEPVVFGLPFAVLVTALLLPLLFWLNMLLYVVGHWAEDRLVPSVVRGSEPGAGQADGGDL